MRPRIKKIFSLSLCIIWCLLLFHSANAYAADFHKAMTAYKSGDYTAAYQEFKTLAEQGDPQAQFMLGSMFGLGRGVPKDLLRSVAWIRKSADEGFPPAEYLIGLSFETGAAVPKDYAKAVEWYRKAAEQGCVEAQVQLGWMYARGEGVTKDYNEAVKWTLKAAIEGDATAQYNLGVAYAIGQGVSKDYVEAVKWYRKAADQGYAPGQASLGAMYVLGEGVPKDYVQAYTWETLAASKGDAKAKQLREIIRDHMTESQIAEGDKSVSAFKPSQTESNDLYPDQYHLHTAEVPLIPDNGVFELPVRINGAITLRFTLDSGASEVNIPADVVSTLVRTGTIQKGDLLPDKTFTLADGSVSIQHRFIIRELDVGGQKLFNITASVGPAEGQLLLGQTFLSRLASWSIDNQRHVFIFSAFQPNQSQQVGPTYSPPPSQGTMASSKINSASPNKWLVILGSDRLDDREKSEKRLALIKPHAPTARIVNSGTYPRLLAGWWVVVEGPFDKATAEKEKNRLLPVVPDAFVRAGW